ncbi:MAG: MaoC family dehydratase [Alphaproteobacteria bacterium]|jgi:acyl dehydratase
MRYFEDIAVGEVWRLGQREVGAEEIIAFATRYDPQPFHTDAAAAEKSFFGGLIASGWHTNAMVMGLLVDAIKAQQLHGLGAPGIDRCRWLVPVRPGDVLSGRVTVMAARRSASRPMGLVTLRTENFNQLNVKVVQMDGVGMYGLRPAPGSGIAGVVGAAGAVT